MWKHRDIVIISIVTVCVVLAGSLLVGKGRADREQYSDIAGHWAEVDILRLSEIGVLIGYGGNFLPERDMTRAELATIMQRLMGYRLSPEINPAETFADLDSDTWFAQACLAAYRAGIMRGGYSRMFRPDDIVTREEAAVVLTRSIGLNVEDLDSGFFNMGDGIAAWAINHVNALAERGIMRGNANGSFEATRAMRRGEFAATISRAFDGIYGEFGSFGGERYDGVLVRGAGVMLRNAIVAGNLVIAEGVGDEWVLLDEGTEVEGWLVIRGGGEEYGIIIDENVMVRDVLINRQDGPVRVVFEGESGRNAERILVESDGVVLVGEFGANVISVGDGVGVLPRVFAHDGSERGLDTGGRTAHEVTAAVRSVAAPRVTATATTAVAAVVAADEDEEDEGEYVLQSVPVPAFSDIDRLANRSGIVPTGMPLETDAGLHVTPTALPRPPGGSGLPMATATPMPPIDAPTPTVPQPTEVPIERPVAPRFSDEFEVIGAVRDAIDFRGEHLASGFWDEGICEWWIWNDFAEEWELGEDDLLEPCVFREWIGSQRIIVHIRSGDEGGLVVIPARREAPEFEFPIARPQMVFGSLVTLSVFDRPVGSGFEAMIIVRDGRESRWEPFVFGVERRYRTESGEDIVAGMNDLRKMGVRWGAIVGEEFASEENWGEWLH